MPGERMVSVIALVGTVAQLRDLRARKLQRPTVLGRSLHHGRQLPHGPSDDLGRSPRREPVRAGTEVTLSPFFIDIDPVSNAQYKACFDAGACPDESPPGPCQGPLQAAYSILDPALADYPMATATVDGAEAYCRSWASGCRRRPSGSGPPGARRASTTPGATRRRIARRCTAICRRSIRTFLIPREAIRSGWPPPTCRRRASGGC